MSLKIRAAALVLALSTLATSAFALEPGKDGWYHTGDATRVKKVVFVNVNVYAIRHDMKCVPTLTHQGVIDADCDKKFTVRMLRDVDHEKIVNALRESFAKNNYSDAGKINQMLGAFTSELKEGSAWTISYNSGAKTTTIWVQGGGSATIAGEDFMKGVWRIWFGNIDPASISDQLMANLKK